ncbi:hypothetical protein ADEAN_000789400 [Angomonas deanei]|uniref:Uncharacterized protein n=1 Tax=Angomonas deanei TaxID=59799 RepID=A0A7G2CKM8_9TRYP|nr:hypothetical protein ADEAN_000789400 [Angomonas deanei]
MSVPDLPYFPRVEDDLHIIRYLTPQQNTLAKINQNLLSLLYSPDRNEKTARQDGLMKEYRMLWGERDSVPSFLRREWFSVALEVLAAQEASFLAFGWLLEVDSTEQNTKRSRDSENGKKQEKWSLWSAPKQRKNFVHYLTLLTFTPINNTNHSSGDEKQDASFSTLFFSNEKPQQCITEEDLTKMDHVVFSHRVRAWVNSYRVLQHVKTNSTADPFDKWMEEIKNYVKGEGDKDPVGVVLRRMWHNPAETHSIVSFIQLRMLTEIALVRLHTTPRCMPTWRLFRDVLRTLLTNHHPNNSEMLERVVSYVEDWLIPYLEMRDRHAGNMLCHYSTLFEVFTTHTPHGLPTETEGETKAEAILKSILQGCRATTHHKKEWIQFFPSRSEKDTFAVESVNVLNDYDTMQRRWLEFIGLYFCRCPLESFDHRVLNL